MVNRHQRRQFDALTKAISRVVLPVMVCMALSVWFVHSLGDSGKCKQAQTSKSGLKLALTLNDDKNEADSPQVVYSTKWAAIFVSIFVVLIVVCTFLIVFLYKTGRERFIKAWLVLAVFVILAYIGGVYIFDFCRSHCLDLDWITLAIAGSNFTVAGLFSVFGIVPRLVNQAYLVVMSALMSYIFRTLPSWSIWTILAVLVLWDLFAVLSKYGPLRILVEAAKETGAELPALVYDTDPKSRGRGQPSGTPSSRSSRSRSENADPNSHGPGAGTPPQPGVSGAPAPSGHNGFEAANPNVTVEISPTPTETTQSVSPEAPSVYISELGTYSPTPLQERYSHQGLEPAQQHPAGITPTDSTGIITHVQPAEVTAAESMEVSPSTQSSSTPRAQSGTGNTELQSSAEDRDPESLEDGTNKRRRGFNRVFVNSSSSARRSRAAAAAAARRAESVEGSGGHRSATAHSEDTSIRVPFASN